MTVQCRLALPGCLQEDGRETAQYDSDTGKFSKHVLVCTAVSEVLYICNKYLDSIS